MNKDTDTGSKLKKSRGLEYTVSLKLKPDKKRQVTVELGLCHCSRLPGKVDNQTD